MDRGMDDGRGSTNWMKGRAFFRADYRRAIDRVIDYFGDSPASALSPQRRIGESESLARDRGWARGRHAEPRGHNRRRSRRDEVADRISLPCELSGTHASPGALEVACGLSEAKGRS